MPNVTPFLIETDVCRDMINYVESKENKNFQNFFMDPANELILEFFLYTAFSYFLLNRNLYQKYKCANHVTFFPDKFDSKEKFNIYLNITKKRRCKFIGIHHDSYVYLKGYYLDSILKIWTCSGLFKSYKEANNFAIKLTNE